MKLKKKIKFKLKIIIKKKNLDDKIKKDENISLFITAMR
jgi:hypothetical protein